MHECGCVPETFYLQKVAVSLISPLSSSLPTPGLRYGEYLKADHRYLGYRVSGMFFLQFLLVLLSFCSVSGIQLTPPWYVMRAVQGLMHNRTSENV